MLALSTMPLDFGLTTISAHLTVYWMGTIQSSQVRVSYTSASFLLNTECHSTEPRHFGLDVIQKIAEDAGVDADANTIKLLYHKTYDGFVEAIDGIDNGINQHSGDSNYKVGAFVVGDSSL
jgi:uncharacterized UPF0160 family protein